VTSVPTFLHRIVVTPLKTVFITFVEDMASQTLMQTQPTLQLSNRFDK